MSVKDTYGLNSVTKFECIGHVQKRVGSRLRKLKTKTKGLSGKGKLTDNFIDRLQNYYGIAVRSNVGNLSAMQQNVIAALYHCASSDKKPMHGQCPIGKESWCYFQRGVANGTKCFTKYAGLSNDVLNKIKPVYLELCDKQILIDFYKGILFSDEAHFWLYGYVNKQNCQIWSEANPQVYVETPFHPEKLTVSCALWAGEIFKNDEGHNVTVNGDIERYNGRYRAMITNFFIPEWNNHDVQELWFQQDGATCHTARATIDLLKDTFGDRLISRFGPVNWPPRSCNLILLDYFLWGYVKSLVYANKPQTLDHFEDNIHRVIADIRPQMLEKVIENWTSRLDYIRASRCSPMPEIIFKM
ncbi:uncharacterized protein TNCV_1279161 [Trichonephila clavipes]|nr:uncharacterized protein TNCV_1279161 [Trichonephila clavipes]